jgi:uncharacterized protein (UPF0210 family)
MDTAMIGAPRKVIKHDPALVREIAKIGNNVNQIARWCNVEKTTNGLDILALLAAIERDLREVVDAH